MVRNYDAAWIEYEYSRRSEFNAGDDYDDGLDELIEEKYPYNPGGGGPGQL